MFFNLQEKVYTVNLGNLLRRRRKEKRLTLKEVAEKSHLSEGFLSQIENNVKTPSVLNLVKVCDALGTEMGPLFEELKNQQNLFIFRKSDWGEVDVPHTGFATRRFCPPEAREIIDSSIIILEPGKSIPVRKDAKNSQEILCLMQGTLELEHGAEKVTLVEGDTVHLWTEPQCQAISNIGKTTSVLLWVGTL
jgi:transcriptional regulator with XRE-family HTH domain